MNSSPTQKKLYQNLPETPGVYLMRGADKKILYIGKAVNLRRRVSSYFTRPHDTRIESLVSKIRKVDFKLTPSALEALVLEAQLIKEHQPPYNVREKDDTSFLFFEITNDEFPRVLPVRGKTPVGGVRYGPFTSSSSAREALRILRKIFPWSTHPPDRLGSFKRPCLDYQMGLCPGTCAGAVPKREYQRNIRGLKLFLAGKRERVVRDLTREMKSASAAHDFERAERVRRRLSALEHVRDSTLVERDEVGVPGSSRVSLRIEGYDISNVSGTSAVGSMVVFSGGQPDTSSYRTFKIREASHPDDTGMLREVIERRLKHPEWPYPDLILVDGGLGQVNAVRGVLREHGVSVPLVGLAKGPERKRNDLIGKLPAGFDLEALVRVRDEAHRFAIRYHRRVRSRSSLGLRERGRS